MVQLRSMSLLHAELLQQPNADAHHHLSQAAAAAAAAHATGDTDMLLPLQLH
jgi:hypothetical protein